MTETERKFYTALSTAVKPQLEIFSKVRLEDIIIVPTQTPNREAHRNRIKSSHIDFVLADPHTSKILLAIELDDPSHQQPHRKERDQFKDNALQAANVPLLRISTQPQYNPQKLRQLIETTTKHVLM